MINKILKIYADFCVPCKQLSKELEKFNSVPIVEYDAESEEGEAICNKYNVRNVPTLIFLDQNDVVVNRITGFITKANLETMINNLNQQLNEFRE